MRNCLVFALALTSTPAFAMPDDEPWDPPPGSSTLELCTDAINARKQQLVASGINLGNPVGGVRVVSSSFCWQAWTSARIHTGAHPKSVTVAITSSTLARYNNLGSESGLGQAFTEAVVDPATGAKTQRFDKGYIIVHPSFGTRVIQNPLAGLWTKNATFTRFGYPTTEHVANPFGFGSYTKLERGYIAFTNDLGSWIDYTGAGEGRISPSVQLYLDWYYQGATLIRTLAGESPVALRPQFGTLDNQTTSLTISQLPSRASLYLFDESPLEGRYVRITGADASKIKVATLGTWMNDRPSSMMLFNHGTASRRSTLAELVTQIKDGLDDLDDEALMRDALRSYNGSGSIQWNNDTTVSLIPGERLLQFTRSGYMNVDAQNCWGDFDCNADGTVLFNISVRPYVVMIRDTTRPEDPTALRPSVHMLFVEGSVISQTCNGAGCTARNDALDDMFSIGAPLRSTVEGSFDKALDAKILPLNSIERNCVGFGVRRVNVLPDALEFVFDDDATRTQTCTKQQTLASQLDFVRPAALITNGSPAGTIAPSFGSSGGVFTVVPDFELPNPPPVMK